MFIRGLSGKRKPGSVPVYLNVYDLTPINGYAYWLGLGVYHSGVQVHGVEYAYGAHEQATTGIFEAEPRQCPGFAFRKSILMGRTEMGPREVRELMEALAEEFTGSSYNLISKNCNHFCNEACLRLTAKPIPRWVNRLAKIGFLCNCMLPATLNVPAMRQQAAAAADGNGGKESERRKLRSNSSRYATTATAHANTTTTDSASAVSSGKRSGSRRRRSSSMADVSTK